MKPILKNFSGSGVFQYQIRPEIKPNLVELNMNVLTPFMDGYTHIDTIIGLFDSESGESSANGFERAFKKAEDKWKLKLIKADLEVA